MKCFSNYIKEEQQKINWAVGSNSSKLQDKWIKYNAVLLILDIEKVMKDADELALNIHSENGGENANKNRIERLYQHIEKGGFLDPPLIGFNDAIDKISFGNGRHRTFVAYKLGHKKIPFYVPKNQKDFFERKYK